MKRFIYACLFLLSFLSCRQSSVHRTLSSLDSLLSVHPDNVLTQLDSLKKTGACTTKEDEMYAKLLRYSAMNQCYLPLDDVKDINDLVLYYLQMNDKDLLPRAYYLKGRCLHDKDSIPQAISYYHKSLECLNESKSDNMKLRGAVNAQIGDLFVRQNYLRLAKKFYREACRCDSLCHDRESLAYDLRDIATIYEYLDQKDSAIFFAKQALAIATTLSDDRLKTDLSAEVAACYLEFDLDSVRKYLQPDLLNENISSDGSSYFRSLYYMRINDFSLDEKELRKLEKNRWTW